MFVQNKAPFTNSELALSLYEGQPTGHIEYHFYQRVSCSFSITSLFHCPQSVRDFEHLWRLCDAFLATNVTHFQQVFLPELRHSGASGGA
jgi:hypothetical protein